MPSKNFAFDERLKQIEKDLDQVKNRIKELSKSVPVHESGFQSHSKAVYGRSQSARERITNAQRAVNSSKFNSDRDNKFADYLASSFSASQELQAERAWRKKRLAFIIAVILLCLLIWGLSYLF